MSGQATLEDVARRAGVSLATASGALTEAPRFSAATIARVRQAMRDLNYEPRRNKLRDRSIRRSRARGVGTVAFVFPDPSPGTVTTPLSAGMLQGAEAALLESKRQLAVVQVSADEPVPAVLNDRSIDGVIIRTGHLSPQLLERLYAVPTVFALDIAFVPEAFDCVRPDNEAIGHMAAEYLLDQGRKRFMAVWVGLNNAIAIRAISFQLACEQHGATCEILRYKGDDVTRAASKIAGMKCRPEALYWPGSLEQIAKPLEERGVRVGEDLDVVCGSDYSAGALTGWGPRIAGVVCDPVEVGRAAARQLTWRMRHPHDPVRKILVPPALVTP